MKPISNFSRFLQHLKENYIFKEWPHRTPISWQAVQVMFKRNSISFKKFIGFVISIERKSQSMAMPMTSLRCLHSDHTIEMIRTWPRGKCFVQTIAIRLGRKLCKLNLQSPTVAWYLQWVGYKQNCTYRVKWELKVVKKIRGIIPFRMMVSLFQQ